MCKTEARICKQNFIFTFKGLADETLSSRFCSLAMNGILSCDASTLNASFIFSRNIYSICKSGENPLHHEKRIIVQRLTLFPFVFSFLLILASFG